MTDNADAMHGPTPSRLRELAEDWVVANGDYTAAFHSSSSGQLERSARLVRDAKAAFEAEVARVEAEVARLRVKVEIPVLAAEPFETCCFCNKPIEMRQEYDRLDDGRYCHWRCWPTATQRADRAEAERDAAVASNAEMRRALEPFAKAAETCDGVPDDWILGRGHNVTVGDLRRAAIATGKVGGG